MKLSLLTFILSISLSLSFHLPVQKASYKLSIKQRNYHTLKLTETNVSIEKKLTSHESLFKVLYASLWLAFTGYAFGLAPVGDPTFTQDVIQKVIAAPFDGNINPYFATIFNLLGVYPAMYASLLLPGSKNQSIPAPPFVFGSFALGFFGLGPYLALRKRSTSGVKSDAGLGYRLFESKLSAIALLGFTLYLLHNGITSPLIDGGDKVADFIRLFSTQQIVHVSTIDFAILTLAIWEPLHEDMVRRKWTGPSALTVSALPLFGPILYLLTRPPLSDEEE